MGILRTLLLAPLQFPLSGTLWVAEKIREAAETEFTDPVTIRRTLRDLEIELEAGRIDEPAFEAAEAVLLARLRAAPR